MSINRRSAIGGIAAIAMSGLATSESQSQSGARRVRKIATEEACCIPEIAERYAKLSRGSGDSLYLKLMKSVYDAPANAPSDLLPQLLDFDAGRLKVMDDNKVDIHLLSQTAPGVQMFDADTGTAMAALSNDRIAEAVRKHPTRFAGLATVAPQDPKRAVLEMERAIRVLKLNGFIINSHTNNEYLDLPKF